MLYRLQDENTQVANVNVWLRQVLDAHMDTV